MMQSLHRIARQRAPGWTSWYKGEMPVPGDTRINVATRFTDGMNDECRAECEGAVRRADEFDWTRARMYDSVTAYRVVEG